MGSIYMRFENIQIDSKSVIAGGNFSIVFEIKGASKSWFDFPFSNESLIEKLIQFEREEQ